MTKGLKINKEVGYKIVVSILFGVFGFIANFHTIIFPFGIYTSAILLGLLFPMLITLSWGWKYGLISAIFGGCQSMWWLWGPLNGYAIFSVVPPFTFWIVWHGIFAELRRNQKSTKWWLNMYIVEIPFRILTTINLITLSRWLVTINPTPWNWGSHAPNTISVDFSNFVVVKQAAVGYIILLLADVLFNIKLVRRLFKLKEYVDYRKTGFIISTFLLLGCLFWLIDSIFYAFFINNERSFIDLLVLNIPDYNIFVRTVFFIFCLASGLLSSMFLKKQRKAEIDLRHSEKQLLGFFNHGNIGMAITSLEKGWVNVNKKLCDLLGYSKEELMRKTWTEMTHQDDLEPDLTLFNQMETGEIQNYEMEKRFYKKDGNIIYTHLTVSCSRHPDGTIEIVLATLQDISNQKQAEKDKEKLEEQLRQAQKMESIGRLAGGVAHDYNNISSIIIGYSEFALGQVKQEDPLHEDLEEILTAAKRSTDITRQLLAFARKQTIAPKVLDLNEAIGNLLKMLQRLIGEDIDLVWSPCKETWPVKIDPSQVDQIVANMGVNARDAIEDVGKVTIETENISFNEEYCSYHAGFIPGDYVLLAVSDDGCGIDAEIMDKIFEPFFTTKGLGKGTGLGLSTVYGIVKQNKGFVNIYSEPNKGTTIKVYLPRHEGLVVEAISDNEIEIPLGQNEKVLLVEDDSSILKLSKRILEELGYTVLPCSNPFEALKLSEGQDGEPDLLITDVIMPGMNGRELSENLKNTWPNLSILFISGYTANVIAHRGLLKDDINFIQKPFSKKDMAIKIREVLDNEKI